MQKCLVDLGDKEAKIIGFNQWIGSTEVDFVLETACGVHYRFISMSQGSDLSSKTRKLMVHFNTQGIPVMIDGGVHSHRILGVVGRGDCRPKFYPFAMLLLPRLKI